MVAVRPVRNRLQELAALIVKRESGIDRVIRGPLDVDMRTCPECNYPVERFRKTCWVCGFEVGRQLVESGKT
ncbi:MAG: hypothetical protein IPK82_08310 [Polyangiaceae bacterium]|nr:hypothetical protein [Polyangiaceae bacterium]